MVVRRRPTLPHRHQCSTIGAEGLSFRVRNGTGRFPFAMTAVTLGRYGSRLGHNTYPICGQILSMRFSIMLWFRVPDRISGTPQWTRSIAVCVLVVVKLSAY